MGLLDEAIREHLELKRRRGGDPTEIERLEREALGPVRRVGQEAPAEPVAAESPESLEAGELGESAEYRSEDEYADELDEAYGPDQEDEYELEQPEAHEEPNRYAAGSERPLTEEPEATGTVPPPDPVPAGEPEPERSGRPVYEDPGVETAEYDVEAAHAEEDRGEDVLEETPEFLQDAPDHDRLWFEQRPPRDFDFDG
jgi:hypothetical protein